MPKWASACTRASATWAPPLPGRRPCSARAEERAVRKAVGAHGRRLGLEQLLLRRSVLRLGDERRRARPDDVGELGDRVDRRAVRLGEARGRRDDGQVGLSPHRPLLAVERSACGGARPADSGARMPQQRAERGARDEQDAEDECRRAEDQRARLAEEAGDDCFEALAHVAAPVLPEDEQQARGRDGDARAERAEVDEGAAADHQPAERDEGDRQHVSGVAEQRRAARLRSSRRPGRRPSRGTGRPRGRRRLRRDRARSARGGGVRAPACAASCARARVVGACDASSVGPWRGVLSTQRAPPLPIRAPGRSPFPTEPQTDVSSTPRSRPGCRTRSGSRRGSGLLSATVSWSGNARSRRRDE